MRYGKLIEINFTKMTKSNSLIKNTCSYIKKADWVLAFALLINLRLDQTIIVFFRYLLQNFFSKKYTQDVLQTLSQEDFSGLQSTFTNLDAIITFGLGFILPAISLLLVLSVRKDVSVKPLAVVSILISLLVMFSSLVSALGYIVTMSNGLPIA